MIGTTLRPLGVGEIIDRTIALFRADLRLFVGIVTVPYLAVVILGSLPFFIVGSDLARLFTKLATQAPERAARTLLDLLPVMIGFGLLVGVVTVVQSAALIEAAAARHLGRSAEVCASLRAGLRAGPRLMLVGIAALVLIFGVAVLGFVGSGIGFLMGSAALGSLLGLLVLPGVIISVYLAFMLPLLSPVTVLEPGGPRSVIRRSLSLVRGNRRRIFGLTCILGLLQVVLSAVLSLLLVSAVFADATAQFVAQQAVSFLVGIVWTPLEFIAFTVFYIDLRVRKEAYDLQLAAEALPRDT